MKQIPIVSHLLENDPFSLVPTFKYPLGPEGHHLLYNRWHNRPQVLQAAAVPEGEQVLRLLDLPGRHLRRRRCPRLRLDRDHRQLPGKRPCRFFGWRIFTLCYFFSRQPVLWIRVRWNPGRE